MWEAQCCSPDWPQKFPRCLVPSIHPTGINLKSNVKMQKKIVKWKTLQKVTIYIHWVFFFFLKTKKIFTETNFQQTVSLQVLHPFDFPHSLRFFSTTLSSSYPQTSQKSKHQFNPENEWLSAMLSLTTSGHKSSTRRTTSSPAESHSWVAVSGIHKDSERRAKVNRSGAWTLE